MFASKAAMQHVSKPNVLMNARLQRLGRYYKGMPVLVWCYPLQELPNGIRDWAPTTELLRRSTSGGAIRYGLHTWDCYSVTQATIALSSAESEFYATGSGTARGLQCKVYLSETERPCEVDVVQRQHSWAPHVPTDGRRQSTPSGIAFLVDSGTG